MRNGIALKPGALSDAIQASGFGSVRKFAQAARISHSAVVHHLNGDRRPTADSLGKYAETCGKPVTYFTGAVA